MLAAFSCCYYLFVVLTHQTIKPLRGETVSIHPVASAQCLGLATDVVGLTDFLTDLLRQGAQTAEGRLLGTGGMPSSRRTTSTLAPNYFYIRFVSFCPAVTTSLPVTTWQARSGKQGPRRDLNLKGHRSGLRSQIRSDFGHLPGAARRGPLGYVIVSGGLDVLML